MVELRLVQSGGAEHDNNQSTNPRASRNMAEKQRRDNLNNNITAMAQLLPTALANNKRMDKISILRLSATYLRSRHALGQPKKILPSLFSSLDLEKMFARPGEFIIVTSTTGKIIYVSQQVEQTLGHPATDIAGHDWYDFLIPEDREILRQNLTFEEPNGNDDDENLNYEKNVTFTVRMCQRSMSRRDQTHYEILKCRGVVRYSDGYKLARRERTREAPTTANDIVFVGSARLQKECIKDLSFLDMNQDEYVTRHLVDGRIVFCDQRISMVAGYMSEEVYGLSAFRFMHKDDVRWTMIGLRQMYDRGSGFGSSCYRLLSKNGQFIYLRTYGYLERDFNSQSVLSFVCINTLVTKEEGERLVQEMKSRFSAIITTNDNTKYIMENDEDAKGDESNSKSSLEDPSKLDDVITHLVSAVSPPPINEEDQIPEITNTQCLKVAVFSQRLPPAVIHATQKGTNFLDDLKRRQDEGKLKGYGSGKGKGKLENNKTADEASAASLIGEKRIVELDNVKSPTTNESNQSATQTTIHMTNSENASSPSIVSPKEMNGYSIGPNESPRYVTRGKDLSMLQSTASNSSFSDAMPGSSASSVTTEVVASSNGYSLTNGNSSKKRALSEDEDEANLGSSRKRFEEDSSCNNIPFEMVPEETTSGYAPNNVYQSQQLQPFESEFITTDFQDLSQIQSLSGDADIAASEEFEAARQLMQTNGVMESSFEEDPFNFNNVDYNATDSEIIRMINEYKPPMNFEGLRETLELGAEELGTNNHAVNDELKRVHNEMASNMSKRNLENPAFEQHKREGLTQIQEVRKKQKQILMALQKDRPTVKVSVKHINA